MKNLIFFFLAALSFTVTAQQPPPVQYVVVHTPGIQWPEDGKVGFDKPWVKDHGQYWRNHPAQVEKGGPFVGRSGGMILLKPGVDLEQAQALAAQDPAVKHGYLNAEIRPWLLVIDNTSNP